MEHPNALRAVDHIGATVADLDRALAFWEGFLGVTPRWRTILDAPYLSAITGYPGVRLNAALIELPGGVTLELLDYLGEDKSPHDPATARPGNVHICLRSADVQVDFARAVALGAQPVSPAPVPITAGPNVGGISAYLRVHDGITMELVQPRPA